MLELALDPRDREKYGAPEWLPFDVQQLDDLPFSVSGKWDAELVTATGKGIFQLLTHDLLLNQAAGKVALAWLALKLADLDPPDFEDFDIRWRLVRERDLVLQAAKRKKRGGDADPPPSGSSEPSPEASP
jgi:hypothetical protein